MSAVPHTPYLNAEVERIARRYRRMRRVRFGLVFLIAAALLLAVWLGRGGTIHDDVARFDGRWFPVDRVVDGDTIRILDDGESVAIRLLGIDTPEPKDPGGPSATDAVRSAIGDEVLLDVHGPRTRDKWGRLLAYVYLDRSAMLNRRLIDEGHAYAYRPKSHPFSREFATAESRARKKQLGLWAFIADDQQPAWRQKWLEEEAERREAAKMPWQR